MAHTGNMDFPTEIKPITMAEFYIKKNGPILVKGKFKIIDINGTELKTENEVYLCQCGKSWKMPFCDESHKKI